ncbi:kinase-like domain-containing protein [Geopyxis carbonaria]|nr:kinase-like domain-containing protein [Geopyxis carbonaria]
MGPGEDYGVEHPHKYHPNGLHPVKIGDIFHDGRYKIVHKLGHGSFSTVWLARDLHAPDYRYVSLKLMIARVGRDTHEETVIAALHDTNTTTTTTADPTLAAHPGRAHIAAPALDTFNVTGPNGTHYAVVSPLYGPNIETLMRTRMERNWLRPAVARMLARQLALALAYIHARGFAHGDLTPSNIVLGLRGDGLAGMSEAEVYRVFGVPQLERVNWCTSNTGPVTPHAPEHVVYELSFNGIRAQALLAPCVYIIDFGVAYPLATPPGDDGVGIPERYAAPESLVLFQRLGAPTDLWALGCCVYAIRAGCALFYVFINPLFEVLSDVVGALGPLPQELADGLERIIAQCKENGRTEYMVTYQGPGDEFISYTEDIGTSEASPEKAVQKPQDSELWAPEMTKISESEAEALARVLEKLLRYDLAERVPAASICDDAWFHEDF